VSATITGAGLALPEHIMKNSDFSHLETSDAWIVKRTGIYERRIISDDESLAELTARAATAALKDAGRLPTDLDRVFVATITPDRVTPGVAVEVATLLDAGPIPASDVSAACSGFLYALDQAVALIESGRARNVLVCGADAMSRIVDRNDRATAVIFGDAAGAAVVSAEPHAPRAHFVLGSDGRHIDLLYADRFTRLLKMRGRDLYEHAVTTMTESTQQVMSHCGLSVDQFDLFVAHQANARIVRAVATRLGLQDEQVFLNVDKVANTTAASIPVAMAEAAERGALRPNARLGLAAFGAGLAWGAAFISWKYNHSERTAI
jgi:3-oxoacyl-[acyl-carrier-protein] synthase III